MPVVLLNPGKEDPIPNAEVIATVTMVVYIDLETGQMKGASKVIGRDDFKATLEDLREEVVALQTKYGEACAKRADELFAESQKVNEPATVG